jgi:hypothetical protein
MLVLTTYAKIIIGQGRDPRAPLLQFRVKGRFAPQAAIPALVQHTDVIGKFGLGLFLTGNRSQRRA